MVLHSSRLDSLLNKQEINSRYLNVTIHLYYSNIPQDIDYLNGTNSMGNKCMLTYTYGSITACSNDLALLQMRCAQYWPDEGEEQYGSISVSLKDVESFADFHIRTFIVAVVCYYFLYICLCRKCLIYRK